MRGETILRRSLWPVMALLGVGCAAQASERARPAADAAPPATASAEPQTEPGVRRIELNYSVEVQLPEDASGAFDIFVPLAKSNPRQRILKREIVASLTGVEKSDQAYGNEFWHAHLPQAAPGQKVTVAVRYEVERIAYTATGKRVDGPLEAGQAALFLKANARVPNSGELIDQVLADLPPVAEDAAVVQRLESAYRYVIDNMEYKKVGTGWGNGDTFWACSEKYGNCTDYHALLTSVMRAQEVPTRFSIGLPVPEDKPAGSIKGYHCWVDAWVPGSGWFPMDASEEDKDATRDMFGKQPADRVQFSVGRDIQLGQGHSTAPLNYFIYPHVELAGKKLSAVSTTFAYKDLGT